MRRFVLAALPLCSLILAGCDMFGEHHDRPRYFAYCDETGCYTCDGDGCQRSGDGHTGTCKANTDCTEGCYCDVKTGSCIEAGYCDRDSDCSRGMVCETARHSCMPGSTGCTSNANCKTGEFCNAGKCTPTWQCTKDADCGTGMKCDERNTCVPGQTGCTKDTDCAAGAYCASGTCKTTAGCKADGDCASLGTGFVCDVTRGTCKPGTITPPACKIDADCGAGKACQNGTCVALPPPGCKSDADCKTGETCSNGTCSPCGPKPQVDLCVFNVECAGGQCRNGLCEKKCGANTDCGTGDVCVAGYCRQNPNSNMQCIYNKDCGTAKTCVNGACHIQCTVDTDCTNKADFCDTGLCKPDWRRKPQCTANKDCAAGLECVNALCRTHCFASSDCGQCADGPICQMGYCMSSGEINPQCKVKTDCGTKDCINALCQ